MDVLAAITLTIARRKGREVIFDGATKLWSDQGRFLLACHLACEVCGRLTRWRTRAAVVPCCSRACYRTRFDA